MTDYLLKHWQSFLIPLAVLLATVLAAAAVRRTVLRNLKRRARRTETRLDDIALATLSGPFMLWALILAVHLAMQVSELPAKVTRLSAKALLILWVISLTMAFSRLASSVIKHYGERAQGVLPVTTLTQNLARLVIGSVGVLILLNLLGVSITPMLTALGVGGLAVALALQDTLSNLFAGLYVSLAGQVRLGDYIRLDSSEEGYVIDITWRSTTLRALPNNLVVIPNAKLAQAIVTNFHLPEKRMALPILISVSYDSDPDHIERVLLEEARRGAGEIPGLLAEPAPVVRFNPGFGESSLGFTLICHVAEFVDQFPVQHELRRRIFKRFRQEGIVFPFPARTLYFANPPPPAGAGPPG